jgi:hypothetical protein
LFGHDLAAAPFVAVLKHRLIVSIETQSGLHVSAPASLAALALACHARFQFNGST